MRKVVVAGVSALSIAAGSAAVAFVVPTGIALAQDAGPSTTTPAPEPGARRGGVLLDEALKSLVADGTITEAQASAVKAKLTEAASSARERIGERRAEAKAKVGATLEEIATYLGTDVASLREQLRTTSLGEIAGDKKAGLVALLTDKANARIDELAAKGAITAEKAAELKTSVPERVSQMVDRVGGHGGLGGPGGPGKGGPFGGRRGGR